MDDDVIINCKELTVLPEIYGEGSKYCYDMFMYIYDDFITNTKQDIYNIFVPNKLNMIIHNNKRNILPTSDTKHNDYIDKLLDKIYETNNKTLYIILPMSVLDVGSITGHAITIIFEFNNSIQVRANILNSGYGIDHHILYDDKYLNYVYSIEINYKFNSSNYINNGVILVYLLYLFYKNISTQNDVYFWLSVICNNSLYNLNKELLNINDLSINTFQLNI